MQRQRPQRWDYVWLRYFELGGKRMRRSTLINLICENVEDQVVLSARGYRSVLFRDSTIAHSKSRSGVLQLKDGQAHA